ncbi:MAG: sialate O-acetylesterase [Candidatus Borkfalkiaceae bacterium]|nr:sialate O-acetylesterase [Christensenellaceae bacterium]
MENNKFDIIIVAGQSNAEGNGIKKDDKETISDKVYQIADKNYIGTKVLDDGKVIIDMVYPTEMVFEKAHERVDANGNKFADFSETFAKCYIDGGYLKKGRKVLIIKTAVGGTGFARKEWGVGSILFERLNLMVDYGLSRNKENRIVALLWHQGEHDSFENAELGVKERYNFYYEHFKEQMLAFRKKYGKDIPVIAGEMADSWAELFENKAKCDAVEKATKDLCREIGKASVASSEGLLSNDDAFKNGDNLHFCAESVYELGRRYYSLFEKITKLHDQG